ncbi:MAG: cytochrome c oxidase subunit 4 [Acidimicrobiia bacterium]|nr:cytochrome c oxidase subunit 4 [Acidimicrobiia bacterium]
MGSAEASSDTPSDTPSDTSDDTASGASVTTADEGTGADAHAHTIHMPSPSYYPFVVALGMPIFAYGFVFHTYWLVIVGVLVTVAGIAAWALEPGTE